MPHYSLDMPYYIIDMETFKSIFYGLLTFFVDLQALITFKDRAST